MRRFADNLISRRAFLAGSLGAAALAVEPQSGVFRRFLTGPRSATVVIRRKDDIGT